MSGAASVPLMCLALIFQGPPWKWFAILAVVGLWIVCIKMMRKIYVAESELKSLKEQAKPLEVGASAGFPVVGKANFVWKDSLLLSISNQNPRREVKGVVVRMLRISPPLRGRQINGSYATQDCGLERIKLPFNDLPGDVLNGGVVGHIPVFEAERTAIITIVRFSGLWASDRANEFIPLPDEKYVLTVEATAAGLERKEIRFELSFSLDPTNPIVAATAILSAPHPDPARLQTSP